MKALISVSNTEGIKDFAQALEQLGFTIVATSGTYTKLKPHITKLSTIESLTELEEVFEGRVKTLHPKIFGGILHKRDNPHHLDTCQRLDIQAIDLVCVNLYPFARSCEGAKELTQNIIENIDIGGPSLIRAAAKNFKDCIVTTDPNEYEEIINAIRTEKDTLEWRQRLMCKAFLHTAQYDMHIAKRLHDLTPQSDDLFFLTGTKIQDMHYGENPHQNAAFYATSAFAHQFHTLKGNLSFNNLLDINACLRLMDYFAKEPFAMAIIKHGNPCGFATADNPQSVLAKALLCDPVSAYGGVVIFNQTLDETLAKAMIKTFFEVIVAPSITPQAQAIFQAKKRTKLVAFHDQQLPVYDHKEDIRTVAGGFLVQDGDRVQDGEFHISSSTTHQASSQDLKDAKMAYKIAACTKSNSIVLVKNQVLVAIGMGMTSRIDALKSAVAKANEQGLELKRCAMASEAFFPFADSIEEAHKIGVATIIQPGGSIRDKEVIQAAQEKGIALYLTGVRHFLH